MQRLRDNLKKRAAIDNGRIDQGEVYKSVNFSKRVIALKKRMEEASKAEMASYKKGG